MILRFIIVNNHNSVITFTYKIIKKDMKVKDLIEKLKQFDPELNVVGSCIDHTDYTCKTKIIDVSIGDPYDDNGFSSVDNSEVDYDTEYDNNLKYIGVPVVIIDLGDI